MQSTIFFLCDYNYIFSLAEPSLLGGGEGPVQRNTPISSRCSVQCSFRNARDVITLYAYSQAALCVYICMYMKRRHVGDLCRLVESYRMLLLA